MKIKSKLIISFCLVIFVPAFLAIFTLFGFSSFQARMIEKTYGISGTSEYPLSNNYAQILNSITSKKFEELKMTTVIDPEKIRDMTFLKEEDDSLPDNCYIIVQEDGQIYYNGEKDNDIIISNFAEHVEPDKDVGSYMDPDAEALVKYAKFVYPDGSFGTIFIVTATKGMMNGIKTIVIQVAIVILVILLLTASMMILWIYQSMIAPIRKLQSAAENIKEGNLDFEIEASGNDEISELCVTFEEMRQRLKDNAEEKLNNEKENRALISNIAHDLKTPITAVKGYSEGIIDGVANTPEKIDKYIRTIYSKANEMDTLINELTLYTKFDTNRIPYNYAKINVGDYFDDCVEEVGIDLENKSIGLAYYNYVERDVVIIADPEQLRRVVNNIINNSVKYMDRQQGLINIRIKDVGDFIQVEVEDNGKGISQKDLPYIFDRFYRADASRNSATGGSGIGLSIVKKIIEDHGGKIWATSKEGTGTTMYFVIRKFQEVKNE